MLKADKDGKGYYAMKKPIRLTDVEKLEAFDWIRSNKEIVNGCTAADLARHLSFQLLRDISPEIARHAAATCGVPLRRSRRAETQDIIEQLEARISRLEDIISEIRQR